MYHNLVSTGIKILSEEENVTLELYLGDNESATTALMNAERDFLQNK